MQGRCPTNSCRDFVSFSVRAKHPTRERKKKEEEITRWLCRCSGGHNNLPRAQSSASPRRATDHVQSSLPSFGCRQSPTFMVSSGLFLKRMDLSDIPLACPVRYQPSRPTALLSLRAGWSCCGVAWTGCPKWPHCCGWWRCDLGARHQP